MGSLELLEFPSLAFFPEKYFLRRGKRALGACTLVLPCLAKKIMYNFKIGFEFVKYFLKSDLNLLNTF